LVHPFDSINTFRASSCLKLGLNFLLRSLFFEFLSALVDLLSFFEGFVLFFPHPPLIAHEDGMP
jgi:hypothetical protein